MDQIGLSVYYSTVSICTLIRLNKRAYSTFEYLFSYSNTSIRSFFIADRPIFGAGAVFRDTHDACEQQTFRKLTFLVNTADALDTSQQFAI